MRLFSIITLLLFSLLANIPSYAAEKTVLAIIVAHDHPINTITLPELKLIYWRKKNYWGDGQPIHPINLPSDSSLRLEFSNMVLGNAPSAQNTYWNGMYFHGISPPHVVNSEQAALRYVATTKGAIAYVDGCNIDDSIKVLLWMTKDLVTTTEPEKLNCK